MATTPLTTEPHRHVPTANGVPPPDDVTESEAADLLGVSLPFLRRLLDEGTIPSYRTGAACRLRRADVLSYREQDDAIRKKVADELTAEAEELGLGY